MWPYPKCERKLKATNQFHSCTKVELDELFAEKPAELLYQELINKCKIYTLKTKIDKTSPSDNCKIMFLNKELPESNKFSQAHWRKTSIWSDKLINKKIRVEIIANRKFNVCVCIYYPDGTSSIAFHFDYIAIGNINLIPSLSNRRRKRISAEEERKFKITKINLEEGCLIIMGKTISKIMNIAYH